MTTKSIRLISVLTITLLLTISETASAQTIDPEGSIRATWLRANSFYIDKQFEDPTIDQGEGNPEIFDFQNEYTWWFWYDGVWERDVHQCITLDWDYSTGARAPGWWNFTPPPALDGSLLIEKPYAAEGTQFIGLQAYEDDAGTRCEYNTKGDGDDAPCDGHYPMRYYDFPPCVLNNNQNICQMDGATWGIQYEFRYNLPTPAAPSLLFPPAQPENICAAGDIPLTAENWVNPVFSGDGRFRFQMHWQYGPSTDGPWDDFGGLTDCYFNGSTAHPRSEVNFPHNLFSELTQTTEIFFRVRTIMTLKTAFGPDPAGRSFGGPFSAPGRLSISPPPPTILITNNISSCPKADNKTGSLAINVTGKVGNYIYSMAKNSTGFCDDPTKDDCGVPATHFSGANFNATGLAPGNYFLRIANDQAGSCFTVSPVTIGALPLLLPQTADITSVTCPGGTDGAVQIHPQGGVEPWTYQLTAPGGYDADSPDGNFSALPAGAYTSTVTDGCHQQVANPMSMPEPKRIIAETTPLSPTCTAPFNGGVQIDIIQGEGTYSFAVIQESDTVDRIDAATLNTWTAQKLTNGAFTIAIRDAQRLQCDALTLPLITLNLPTDISLLPEDISQKNLTCFEQGDGFIQLSNVDLGGTFKYTIAGENTGTQRTLTTTALFDNLPADSYHVVALRNVDGCTDAVNIDTPVELTQPPKIVITLNKTDVRCFDEANGLITPVVTGGTNTDEYLWETFLTGDWATFNAGRTALDHLEPGTFRLKITNASNCHGASDEITITQPNLLAIMNLELKDIICYGETGSIKATVQGGTLPYSYNYTSTGNSVQSPTVTTLLTEGNYSFAVTDANGCLTPSAQALIITAPPQPLAMAYALSNFNGYEVACAGSSTGYANLVATGGNGATYTGYQYALNDRPFQDAPRFDNLAAGPHTLLVRDARGCALARYVTFIEPANELDAQMIFKNDVSCQTDMTGSLYLKGAGGVDPYIYTLNNNVTQHEGLFTDLGAGDYTILIADANGCSMVYDTEIGTRHTPMTIVLQKTDVSCYGGTNGSIVAAVGGGEGTLQQTWTRGLTPLTNTDQLPAGAYTLTVTDGAGCALNQSINLEQPEDLTTTTTVIPVCVGKETGEIWLETHGGTGSYRYSADGGKTYQDSPLLKNLPAGLYSLRVQDAHACDQALTAEVTVRNDLPKPNFIVASNEHALDTLIIHDISDPKADSVTWAFDPAIQVIDPGPAAPMIRVDEPGSFAIAMTGYFGGCDYTAVSTVNLAPYNPGGKVKIPAPYETIQTLTATPNPTDGVFDLAVALNAKQDIAITIIDFLGVEHYSNLWRKTTSVNQKIDIKDAKLAPGIYILRVVTDTDAKEVRLLINNP